MKPTETQIEKVKNMIVKDLSDDELGEIISIKNIEDGERAQKNFSELQKFGEAIPRPGRVPWSQMEEEAPTYLDLLRNTSGLDEIEEGMFDEAFLDEEIFSDITDEMLEEGEDAEVLELKQARDELLALQEQGLKIDRNLTWDCRKIIRNENLIFYLERDGNDIEFLKELYSHIPDKKMKRIRKAWNSRF